jgi:hypothetical protein
MQSSLALYNTRLAYTPDISMGYLLEKARIYVCNIVPTE